MNKEHLINASILIEFDGKVHNIKIFKDNTYLEFDNATIHKEPEPGH